MRSHTLLAKRDKEHLGRIMKKDYDTKKRWAILMAVAFFVVLGAGCSSAPVPEQTGQQNAPSIENVPTEEQIVREKKKEREMEPSVLCYKEQSDLLFSTAPDDMRTDGLNNVESLLSSGWELREWCVKREGDLGPMYAFTFQKTNVSEEDLSSVALAYSLDGIQVSSENEQIVLTNVDEKSPWSIVKVAYLAFEKNRKNERPLISSEMVAIRGDVGSAGALTSLSFARDLTQSFVEPRMVVAEMRGGSLNFFGVRMTFNPITRQLTTDRYCETVQEGASGAFDPESIKTRCE